MLLRLAIGASLAINAIAKLPPKSCRPGQTVCLGLCVDLQNNVDNCGSCQHACGVGYTCTAGSCVPLHGRPPPPPCASHSMCGAAVSCGFSTRCACLVGLSKGVNCYDLGGQTCIDCTRDSDCHAAAGGICAQETCCPNGACAYPSNDCPNSASKRSIEEYVFGKRDNQRSPIMFRP